MKTNQRPLRIAVAGLGRIGWDQHALSLAKHADFRLVAVSDTEADRRAEAERELKCPAFADYAQMLEQPGLDAAVIATPTHFHKPMALAALRRGLHVILEKPMALDAHEAAAIVRAARRRRRVLTVYQPHRLMAHFQHLRRLIATGRIGRIVHVQNGMFSCARRNDWQALRRYGGGMLANYGAHAIDMTLPLIGYDIRRVFCHRQIIASLGDAEDAVKIVLQTRRGILADIDINQASTISPYRLIVWGTCGAIWLEGDTFHLRRFDPKKLPPVRLNRRLASAGRKYPSELSEVTEETVTVDPSLAVDLYADFARAIRTGAAPYVKPQETLAVMRLMDRCRQSAPGIADMRK
jgi:scyllo-inositol 2-dehydrogenase (NADP+)